MFNKKLMKILGSGLFLFILFCLTSHATADEVGIDNVIDDENNLGSTIAVPTLSTISNDNDSGDDDNLGNDSKDDLESQGIVPLKSDSPSPRIDEDDDFNNNGALTGMKNTGIPIFSLVLLLLLSFIGLKINKKF